MLFYFKDDGTLDTYEVDIITQGQVEAARIDVLSRKSAVGAMFVNFTLPNGQPTATMPMGAPVAQDVQGFNMWSYTLPNSALAYAGIAKISIIYAANGGQTVSPFTAFNIQKSAGAYTPSVTPSDWNAIVAIYQQCRAYALASEGYAVGTQDGLSVEDPASPIYNPDSPYYHNNAKWYSEHATDPDAVHYTEDTGKTEEEKTQARANIGASKVTASPDVVPGAQSVRSFAVDGTDYNFSGGVSKNEIIAREEELPEATEESPDFVEVEKILYYKRGTTIFYISSDLTNATADAGNPSYIAKNEEASLYFYPDDGYRLPENISVSGAEFTWDKSTGELHLTNADDTIEIAIDAELIPVYSITTTLTYVTADAGNPTEITDEEEKTLTFHAQPGYNLPEEVTVTNATYVWDNGVLTISEATGNVSITITATLMNYNISYNFIGVTGTNLPATIQKDATITITLSATQGYALPDEITVSNATSSWNESTGVLTVANPTGDVTITAYGIEIIYIISTTFTNVMATGEVPTSMSYTDTVSFQVTATEGYARPASISVTNAEYTWNQSTGRVTLTHSVGSVSVTIVGEVKQTYLIATNLTGVTAQSSNPTTIKSGETELLIFFLKEGFSFPESVTVTNAHGIWQIVNSYARLFVSNPTGNVTITIVASSSNG